MTLLLLAAALALSIAAVAAAVGRRVRPLRAVLADGTLASERDRFRAAFAGAAAAAPGLDPVLDPVLHPVLDAVHGALMPRIQRPCSAAPATRLCADLGLTAADVEDVALLASAELGGHIPGAAELDALRAEQATVEQLVRFVGGCAAARGETSGRARTRTVPAA